MNSTDNSPREDHTRIWHISTQDDAASPSQAMDVDGINRIPGDKIAVKNLPQRSPSKRIAKRKLWHTPSTDQPDPVVLTDPFGDNEPLYSELSVELVEVEEAHTSFNSRVQESLCEFTRTTNGKIKGARSRGDRGPMWPQTPRGREATMHQPHRGRIVAGARTRRGRGATGPRTRNVRPIHKRSASTAPSPSNSVVSHHSTDVLLEDSSLTDEEALSPLSSSNMEEEVMETTFSASQVKDPLRDLSASDISAHSREGSESPRATLPTSPAPGPSASRQSAALNTNYGSEEDTDDECESSDAPPILVSKIVREFLLQAEEEEEPADSSDLYQSPDLFDFQWREFPELPIPADSRREPFSDTKCGAETHYAEPYDAFTAIWDTPIMEHICAQTNIYAEQTLKRMKTAGSLLPSSRMRVWHNINVQELYIYFATILAMGVVVKSRAREYFSDRFLFSTPGFNAMMSSRRFELISKCLHFNNNENVHSDMSRSEAKLIKLQPIIEHLNDRFSQLYRLNQNIVLDESLAQLKGWFDVDQLTSNKTAVAGIKTYELCESQSGYLWRFEVHTGSKPPQESGPVPGAIPSLVLRLVRGLEHRGHTIWMDSYYSSPVLARALKVRGFDCAGTMRRNRQFVPAQLVTVTDYVIDPGQVVGRTSGDVDLMVWRDKKLVGLISTYHGNTFTRSRDSYKPALVTDYNMCIGGIDKKNQMLAMYPIERKKTKVWYKKFFRRLLNVSVLNAYLLYKHHNPKISHHEFRLRLIEQIVSSNGKILPKSPRKQPRTLKSSKITLHNRFGFTAAQAQHYVMNFPNPPSKKRPPRRVCKVCGDRTQTYCIGCDIPLCAFRIPQKQDRPCFVLYHFSNGTEVKKKVL